MRYRQAAVLGIGCLLLVTWYLVTWYSASIVLSDEGQVLILNAVTEPVKNGQLEVRGQKFPFGEIEQGKSKAIQYKVRSDSHYKLPRTPNIGSSG